MRINMNPLLNQINHLHRPQALGHAKAAQRGGVQEMQASLKKVGTPLSTQASQGKPPIPGSTDPSSQGTLGVSMIECGPPANAGAGSPGMSLDSTLTLDGLMSAWGQGKSSPYDLTGNGVVDVDDLLQFINGLSGPSTPEAPAAESEFDIAVAQFDPDEAAIAIPLESDTAATAVEVKSGPLTAVLPDVVATTVPTIGVPSIGAPPPAAPPMTLDGLMAAWGQTSSAYDLSGNGVVDVDDLLQFINGLTNDQVATPRELPQFATAGPPDVADKSAAAKKSLGGIAQLTDTLIDRLSRAGFEHQPPTNIRDLVDKLGLNARETDRVMHGLSRRYPQGLGVNAAG
jgi:hypothetical protein